MSNKIDELAVQCQNCAQFSVVRVVADNFSYTGWIRDTKTKYANERVLLQISVAASLSKETKVDPDVILDVLQSEFWKHWDWDTHIRVVKCEKSFLLCSNCKGFLKIPITEEQEEQEAEYAAEEIKAFAAFSCGFLNGDPTSIVDYTAHLIKFLKDNKDWIINLQD